MYNEVTEKERMNERMNEKVLHRHIAVLMTSVVVFILILLSKFYEIPSYFNRIYFLKKNN